MSSVASIAAEASARLANVRARAYRVPTEEPESDGTFKWEATTIVIAEVQAGSKTGIGYTYADAAAAVVINGLLSKAIAGANAMDLPACWAALRSAIRNNGSTGLAAMAVSAVDAALWDLKAKLLEVSLVDLLGACREKVMAYGSGGFTSYSLPQLRQQLGAWANSGFAAVKMKIGRNPSEDLPRVSAARDAIGEDVQLFVDANGAYSSVQAISMAHKFAPLGVTWFEEPVDHRDFEGLTHVRRHLPPGMELAVGEYGFETDYFRRLMEQQALDVLQADATRCGVTGFLQVAAIADAHELPMSSHCAPSLHVPLCLSCRRVRNMEYFHDHVRIEQKFFDGAAIASGGMLQADRSRPGLGLELKSADVERFAI